MTAQASDPVHYRGRVFSLAGVSGGDLFDPLAHGFNPRSVVSFCWRGHTCEYAVEDERLLLRSLSVFFDHRYPETIPPNEWEGVTGTTGKNRVCTRYAPLARLVPFTGGLLLADGFIKELYVHMGYHPAWKFREIHELLFEAGRLTSESDLSKSAEEFRKTLSPGKLRPDDPDDRRRVTEWIRQAFSLEYDRR